MRIAVQFIHQQDARAGDGHLAVFGDGDGADVVDARRKDDDVAVCSNVSSALVVDQNIVTVFSRLKLCTFRSRTPKHKSINLLFVESCRLFFIILF